MKSNTRHIELASQDICTGCGACAQECPKNCISMVEDREGFLQPKIDTKVCIGCHKCEKTCPILNKETISDDFETKAYAVINPDEEIRMQSSSGGVFYALAKWVIEQGGVVFGARWDENWMVMHDYAEDLEGVKAFMKSKYVQSGVGDTYKQAKGFLIQNRWVLYSGTPCQLGGLRAFLGKEYEKLIQVDLICHGVPSPGVWRKYLKDYVGKDTIISINMRDKEQGWKDFNFFTTTTTTTRRDELLKNPYTYGFLCDIFLRKCCYTCPYRQINRSTDITIADFWGVDKLYPEMDDNRGTSLVLIHSDKGQSIMFTILHTLNSKIIELSHKISEYNYPLNEWRPMPTRRSLFFKWYKLVGFKRAEFAMRVDLLNIRIKRKLRKFLSAIKRRIENK